MRSRGQTFLPDFLASIAIFGAITAVFLFSWNSVISNQGELSQSQNMRTEARYTTTFMVSTSGYPEDWNASTVEIPGFASGDNLLQQEKIEEFGKLDYEAQKRLLTVENFYLRFRDSDSALGGESLGGEPVAYMTESSSDFSDVKVLQTLNSSDVSWDLYWASGSNQDELDDLTADNVYNYTEGGAVMMEDMVENSSNYGTVIAEDVNIDSSELDNTAELRSYVENGGSFLHTESDPELITQTFDLNNSGDDSETATLEKVSPLINSSYSVGDTVEFDDSNAAYDTPDTVYADGADEDAGCVACEWEIGSGKLFYLSDTFSDNDAIGLAFRDADDSIGSEYSFGEPPRNANTVVPVTRDVLLDTEGGVKDAEMVYTVWR